MDEWRSRLAADLLDAPASPGGALAHATAMEIAFGKARSELTYVLALGRAHRVPITGDVAGDAIWIRLGEEHLAFTFDRASSVISMEATGRANASITRPDAIDEAVREAVDTAVRAWKMNAAKKE